MTDAKDPELAGFEERFLEVPGGRLRYLAAGEGQPVLLVHGLGGAAGNWVALGSVTLQWPVAWVRRNGNSAAVSVRRCTSLSVTMPVTLLTFGPVLTF